VWPPTISMRQLARCANLRQRPEPIPQRARDLRLSAIRAGMNGRGALIERRRPLSPFLERPTPGAGSRRRRREIGLLITQMLHADASGIQRCEASSIANAARAPHRATHIWIAGFHSCRSAPALLNHQLRQFCADARCVAGSGPESLEFGASRSGDAVGAFGFAPFSRGRVAPARAAHRVGCRLVAVADPPAAPMGEDADDLRLSAAAFWPGLFPSLSGAVAIAQRLAAATFVLGGIAARKCLSDAEARLAAAFQ
jgi:hypothetical protein